jgi:hypothetical protein
MRAAFCVPNPKPEGRRPESSPLTGRKSRRRSQPSLNAEKKTSLRLSALQQSRLFARCEEICGSGAAERHEDRKIEDRKMKPHSIFLSSIFLSSFLVRLRLCRAALTAVFRMTLSPCLVSRRPKAIQGHPKPHSRLALPGREVPAVRIVQTKRHAAYAAACPCSSDR